MVGSEIVWWYGVAREAHYEEKRRAQLIMLYYIMATRGESWERETKKVK